MSKIDELKKLEEEIINDSSLPLLESNLVFGEGDINADVLFIGEAPGFHEDQQKRPFVGRSGKLLDKLIMGIGWKREDVYITNIVKRRPPENRDPNPSEIEVYKKYLVRQIRIIKPKIIVALGRISMNYFLPDAKISRDHGKIYKFGVYLFIPFFHPAAALRSTGTLRELTKDFKKLPVVVKKYEELITKTKSEELKNKEDINQKQLFYTQK